MEVPKILKKKSLYIILALVALGVFWFWQRQRTASQITYETADVEKRTLVQTVEVTGEIKPAARIDLAFKSGGTLSKVAVKVGDDVKQGDILAELEADDLNFAFERARAAVAISQANLNQRLAGESDESIRMAQAQLDQAKAAYDKSVSDLANTKIQVQNDLDSATITLNTAKNNLDNTAPVSDQSLANAIETSRLSLKSALGPLNTALVDGDSVVGFDDTATNAMYRNQLGALSFGSMDKGKADYQVAKASKLDAEKAVDALSKSSTQSDILSAADVVQKAVENTQIFLLDVKTVLANTLVSTYFTNADLTAKKAAIDGDYASVSAQKSTVVAARQAIQLAQLSNVSDKSKLEDAYKAAQVAYDMAKTNIDMKVAGAQANLAIQQAAVQSAQAALDLKRAGPRSVDVASFRAQLQDAQVNLAQAENNLNNMRVLAPVEGTVTDVVSDVGEQITPNTPQIRMIGTAQYDIEAKVPEADIAKVKVGQVAEITLDAYGDEIKFKGTVTAENPDQTKVQDAIYYNIRVNVDPGGKDIKPGMTANVTITTGEAKDTLVIPSRAIKTENGIKTVRVLTGGKPQSKTVTIGLKGDEGRVQVLTGLGQGEKVILSEKTGS
jgi:RND family efflux transporter MFP subunit